MATKTEQRLVFALSFIGNFLAASVYSLQAPFFPKEAELKNVSASEYSFVFTVFELTIIVLSPFSGAIVGSIESRLGVMGGLFICGYTCILFGCLSMMPSRDTFLPFAFVIRILEAVGHCIYFISSSTVITGIFADSANQKLAMIEAAFAAGLVAGPAVGGFLYSLGGFMLPFLSTGSFILICLFIAALTFPSTPSASSQSTDKSITIELLKNPLIWVGMYCLFTTTFSSGFLFSTLEPHIRPLLSSSAYVGMIFMISPLMYVLTSGLIGYLTDKGYDPLCLIFLGCLGRVLAYCFIGPFPWLPFQATIYLIVIGQVFNGLAYSFTFTGGFSQLFKTAREMGLPKSDRANAAVSGLWQLSSSVGIGSGPFIGGIMLDLVGFRKGSFIVIVFNVIACSICITLLTCAKSRQ